MTTSSAVWAGVAAAISATLLLASACSGEPTDSSPTSSGPLRLTDGHVGSMLFPLGEPSFITVPACGLSGDLNVEIIAVSAQSVTGTDDVSFLAAWLGPGDELKIGAAGLSKLEDPFEPAAGTSGRVASCAEMPNTLELAVVLPEATDTAVVVEGFTVTYAVGSKEYTALADVTYGVCASDPLDPASEPAECDRSTGG